MQISNLRKFVAVGNTAVIVGEDDSSVGCDLLLKAVKFPAVLHTHIFSRVCQLGLLEKSLGSGRTGAGVIKLGNDLIFFHIIFSIKF